MGEALVIESPAKFQTVYLRLDATVVNGNGIGSGFQTGAYQSHKDFIGRIIVGKSWQVQKAKLGFNASGSYYNGAVLQTTPNVYEAQKNAQGVWFYNDIANPNAAFKQDYKRLYYDVNLQLKADYGVGITMLRGEYIWGTQPGGTTSSTVPLGSGNAPPSSDLYLRKFNGAMFYLTQSFRSKVKNHTMMHDITLKYDWYNPQAQVSGKDLNIVNGFSPTDMKYNTVGVGYSFIPYPFFKLMVWYDVVMNEATSIPHWTSDYKGDNVLTIRTQFYVDSWWFTGKKSKYTDNMMMKDY